MKTARIIVIAVLMLLVATMTAQAQRAAEVSYSDSYRWHGFQTFGDDYVHPGVATNVGQGIDVSTVSHVGEAHDDIEYWDSALKYKLPLNLPVELSTGYGYVILPGIDAQEISVTAQIPGVIAPHYTVAHIIPDDGGSGQIHNIGLDVCLGDTGDPNELSAVISASVTYNDGVNPFGHVVQDWTHATAGLRLSVPAGPVLLQPGVWYQYTMEPEALLCKKQEVWCGVSVINRF